MPIASAPSRSRSAVEEEPWGGNPVTKKITVSIEKCTGCGTCELMCSFRHHGEFNPGKARIRRTIFLHDAIAVPILCLQCEDAWCVNICPAGALTRGVEPKSGAVRVGVNEEKCVGCRMCTQACPYGNITVNERGCAEKCDLCDGDPQCVRFCSARALLFEDTDSTLREHRQKVAEALLRAYEGTV
jgi:anaerobic carbon-monoxide dehydrogenase iron sulfur subunit